MSVIQERVPAGSAEVMHYHNVARQFFYILEGEGKMVFEDHEVVLKKRQGLEIPPQVKHQFKNQSNADVHFLVVSVPTTKGDRINV
jgi:mannose-6-phosphate isomerase-like protein (cupin superfamily)